MCTYYVMWSIKYELPMLCICYSVYNKIKQC